MDTTLAAPVRTHHTLVIVDAEMDGNYDKDGLPDPLILTHYFGLADDHSRS